MNTVAFSTFCYNLTKTINNFLEPFDCEAMMGTDFEYLLDSNIIVYSLITPKSSDDSFSAFAKKEFPNIEADTFLWSFLHELGHRETEDEFEDEEWQEYMKTINSWHGTDDEYYHLPIEYAATAWAADFMQTHTEEVETFWNQVQSLILDFYEKELT